MLPTAHKLASSGDFRWTMKTGTRAGSRTLVVYHAARTEPVITGGPRFGLIVSKAVGNAVIRHRTSRRLRHLCMGLVDKLDPATDIVIRALPGSGVATSAELNDDLTAALGKAQRKTR
ncbi:ribonuclease P protein component [Corynebacterium breve]|uniref:Ribonuclease P protein component n=1 Tax=Corynebacterium breve TaxID=3049799 RepID=A0ABY8VDE5_9CORY|nr:ribonuclease P protein component [Corynebacterium breve]WIM67689.1 ribonuclease P protein component [Corynebacterium breve]